MLKNFTRKPWSKNEQKKSYFKKIDIYINKLWKQPLLGFSKKINNNNNNNNDNVLLAMLLLRWRVTKTRR